MPSDAKGAVISVLGKLRVCPLPLTCLLEKRHRSPSEILQTKRTTMACSALWAANESASRMNRLSEICLRTRSILTTFSRNASHQGIMRHLKLFGLFIWLAFIASGTALGLPAVVSLQQPFPGSREVRVYAEEDVTVWMNTRSGVYHYPGSRWYGNTRSGKFMKEKDAKQAGYRASRSGQ